MSSERSESHATVVVDPPIIDTMNRIFDLMARSSTPSLGLNWCITIETNGRPVAAVRRTRDNGIKMELLVDPTSGKVEE